MFKKNKQNNIPRISKGQKMFFQFEINIVPAAWCTQPLSSQTDTLTAHWLLFSAWDQIAPKGTDSTAVCRLQETLAHLKIRWKSSSVLH